MIDVIAFFWFFLCWGAFSCYATIKSKPNIKNSDRANNLTQMMRQHRLNWMKESIKRYDRLLDIRVIAGLMQSVNFLASTSILIVVAITPIFGYGDKIATVLAKIPLLHFSANSYIVWEFKCALIIAIFIYSFFKFTWALRQYNYASILLAATPQNFSPLQEDLLNQYVLRNTEILVNASKHSTFAVRGYYFGLASLSWLIGAVPFMIVVTIVVYTVYRREFLSKALGYLS